MKTFPALCLIVTLAISLPQFALGQGNPEATKLAKEGAQANKNQDWDKAVDAFRKAAAIDRKNTPNLAAVLQKRAMAYVAQQNFPMALEDLNEALKIMPNDATAHERRAYVEMQVRDYDKALADYSDAIKERPNEVRYLLTRSYILELKGDFQNSMADTEKVLRIDRKNAEALGRKTRIDTILKQRANAAPPHPPPPGPAPGKTP